MDQPSVPETPERKVAVVKDGPYLVTGGLPLAKEIIVHDENEGCPTAWAPGERYPDRETYALCRCGQSEKKPFCDGAHVAAGFDGTETAGRGPYLARAEALDGKDIVLLDAQPPCARARFCNQGRGIWHMAATQKDATGRARAEQVAGQCPAGRLVVRDKVTGTDSEPDFEPSISLIEEPNRRVSGGIWLKGGVPVIAADGTPYEARNRVTLCRCGQSESKPFCDGRHIDCGFDDGDASLKS